MKHVVKSMLVWVISFSLVIPICPVWADSGMVDIEVEVENAGLRRDAKRFAEEQKRAQEHAQAEITLTRKKLAGHLDDVRNGIVFNGLIGNFFKSLENDDDKYRTIYPRLKAKIALITGLSHRLKSLSESYERIYGEDNDYSWTEFQGDLELDADGNPIIKVNYQGKDLKLDLSTFSAVPEKSEETETAPKGRADKAEPSEEDSWSRVFGRAGDGDDDDEKEDPRSARESARTELIGCEIPEHDNRPSSGERVFGLGALTLFGIGAGVLAGVNTSYLYKERKSLRHQMERASAHGDSPFLYHGAYAALNYQNPLGGLGETLGPISMAISSILMPGNQGYLSQMEYLRNMRLRSILDAMARTRVNTNVTQSSTRKIEIQRNLQGLDNISKSLFGDMNDLSDKIDGAFKNIGDQLTGGMSQSELNQAIRSINNMSQGLSVLGGLKNMFDEAGDRIKKEVAEAAEAAKNAQDAINSNGGFTQTIEQTSSGRFSSNRSGVSTGPNGFLGAPGFPQTGGSGFDARFRFGPR